MKTLFLENYKGFKKAFLPILDINFFVGENSTGKTAILNLLNIMSKSAFWINLDFNNDEVELGYFEEIANKVQPSEEKYFKIGIEFSDNPATGKNDNQRFLLLHFKDKEGIPGISGFKMNVGNKSVSAVIKENKVEYQIKEITDWDFQQWISDIVYTDKSHELPIPTEKAQRVPFGLLKSMIISEVQSNEMNDKERIKLSIKTPFPGHFLSFAPICAKAQRTYESYKQDFSPEGAHTPSLLYNILSTEEKRKRIIPILEKFGKDSNLFAEIQVTSLGDNKNAPFEINVLYNHLPIKITNVGYGVSQILPLLIESLTSENDFFSFQQPEVHLHPKAQAAFGEFIMKSFAENKNRYIIETHSDFTINRFRYVLSKLEGKAERPKSQVVFFERTKEGTEFICLELDKAGNYPEDLPDSYGAFFLDEELKMLEL